MNQGDVKHCPECAGDLLGIGTDTLNCLECGWKSRSEEDDILSKIELDPSYLEFLMEVYLKSHPFFEKALDKMNCGVVVAIKKHDEF